MRTTAVLVLGAMTLAVLPPAARADDQACEAVLAAMIKQTTVPVRQKITIENPAGRGSPDESETIRVDGMLYVEDLGQWTARPYDSAKAAEAVRQAMQKAEHSCTRLRSEPVDGQAADLYSVHSKTATSSSDAQVWIASATGLPLRYNATMEQRAVKVRSEARYDYANVRAPAGVAR